MAEAKTQLMVVNLGGIKYAWRAKKSAYEGIKDQLGVVFVSDVQSNMAFSPKNKPPRVRLSMASGRSYIRFCDPEKLQDLLTKGTLNSKKLYGDNINSVNTLR